MKRLGFAVAAITLWSLTGDAHGQQIVHDPTSYAKLVEEARTAVRQLEALQAQVRQGEALFDSLNDVSDVNRIAVELGLPEVRNPLPTFSAIRNAAAGDLDALGDLATRADAIREANRLYSPSLSGETTGEDWRTSALERSGDRAARDLALADALDASADRRLQGIEDLRRSLDTATNARAVMDLQARLTAEQAQISNEQTRLQALELAQDAERRLEDQRARERSEAARSARLQLYRSVLR